MLKFRIFHTHGFVVVAGRAGQPSGSLSPAVCYLVQGVNLPLAAPLNSLPKSSKSIPRFVRSAPRFQD